MSIPTVTITGNVLPPNNVAAGGMTPQEQRDLIAECERRLAWTGDDLYRQLIEALQCLR